MNRTASGMIVAFILTLIVCCSMDTTASKEIEWGFNILLGFCSSAFFFGFHNWLGGKL